MAVAVGGALGSRARHWVNSRLAHRGAHPRWPTFAVNVIGCLVIGGVWLGYYLGLRTG